MYHWQQEVGWLLEKVNGDLIEVKRFPDVIVRKNGEDVLVIDAKCMRYSEITPDHKQEPGPPRDIVNQMIIYLDYGNKKDLGLVLFADDRPHEEIVVKQTDSRKIMFLNCYPYSDSSKVAFDRLHEYMESYV